MAHQQKNPVVFKCSKVFQTFDWQCAVYNPASIKNAAITVILSCTG